MACKVFDIGFSTISTVLPCLDYCRVRRSRVMVVGDLDGAPPTQRT